jgi:hypothetical protein
LNEKITGTWTFLNKIKPIDLLIDYNGTLYGKNQKINGFFGMRYNVY